MVTEKMIEAAQKAVNTRHGLTNEEMRKAIEAALSTDAEPVDRQSIDAWLEKNCGVGIPYQNATDTASMLHGLAYVLRQIESTNRYMVNIGQTGPATSALRMALDHFALSALSAQVQDVAEYEYRLLTAEGREYARLNAKADEEAHKINDGNFAGRLTVQRRVVPEWEVIAAPAAKLEGKP